MPKIQVGAASSSFFNLDGLDYGKNQYQVVYNDIEVDISGDPDLTKANVGLFSKYTQRYIQQPTLFSNWTNASDTPYASVVALLTDLDTLVGFESGGGGGGSGDMILAAVQTVTGAKTFLDTTFLLRNVANTFNGSFVNTNTGDRIYTLPDASGPLLVNIVEDTTPQLGGELDTNGQSVGGDPQTATGDGATTIDWKLGNTFDFQFGAFNETFTFTDSTKAGVFILKLVQDSVGSRAATWPGTVQWVDGVAPTLTTTATTGTDIITFYYDGTNYFAVHSLNFS